MIRKFIKLVLILVVLVVVSLLGAALYLSPQDKLEKADVIVVISGGDTDARLAEGIKLYKENYAPEILFSGAAAEGTVSNAAAMRNIAIQNGVLYKDILTEGYSKTTEENGEYSAKIIHAHDFHSLILVTSPYHQRRAYEAFRTYLGKNFKIINHSATDTEWRKADWWGNPQARFLTVGEILKNLYFLIYK